MILQPVNVTIERQIGAGRGGDFYLGDTCALMNDLIARYGGKVQLIYLDPPFQTGDVFLMKERVGEKEWRAGQGTLSQTTYRDDLPREEYLSMMRRVLTGCRELLSDTGVIYLHADWHIHPHLRLLLLLERSAVL